MINTVLGPIEEKSLGATLMHEHIIVNQIGADFIQKTYTTKEVVDFVLPYLIDLKKKGCSTIVEATPGGFGRDLEVLAQCAKQSGLNILTCTGFWDGGDGRGITVPEDIRNKSIDEIASVWIAESENGIENTGIKPGFIKTALGDEGQILPLQEKLLRAAIRTSLHTGLRIQCHGWVAEVMPRIVEILEEEHLPFDHFIWIHADASMDMEKILTYANKGMWIQFDGIACVDSFEQYAPAIKRIIDENLLNHLLFGQDSGSFNVKKDKKDNKNQEMRPYATFYDKFIPYCLDNGIDRKVIDQVIIDNTRRALTLLSKKD